MRAHHELKVHTRLLLLGLFHFLALAQDVYLVTCRDGAYIENILQVKLMNYLGGQNVHNVYSDLQRKVVFWRIQASRRQLNQIRNWAEVSLLARPIIIYPKN